nr:toxin-activating lysine-acyltransferase [uncultured Hyphomonas sp.]
MTWLLSQSPVHKQLFIGDLEWFVMPPLLLEQFRIFHGQQHPVGVAFWARVSEETDARLRDGAFKLRVDEWKGGNIPWLIELIAPFGGQEEMMADLSAAIFPKEPYNFHQVNADGKREVSKFSPAEKN